MKIKKEIIEAELATFWANFATILPKSRARSEIGDKELFIAFKDTFFKMIEYYRLRFYQKKVEFFKESFKKGYNEGVCKQIEWDLLSKEEQEELLKSNYTE